MSSEDEYEEFDTNLSENYVESCEPDNKLKIIQQLFNNLEYILKEQCLTILQCHRFDDFYDFMTL